MTPTFRQIHHPPLGMDIEPWHVMAGLTVLLVLIGAVTYFRETSPLQVVIYLLMFLAIIASMYFGYRLGEILSDRRA